MTTKDEKQAQAQGQAQSQAHGRWQGDAVEDAPGDEAERAAARAEGNSPVPVSIERERIQEPPSTEEEPMRVTPRPRHTDDPEEEIAETAEEHQERHAGEQPPRGKL